jgi:hypothetical protein
MKFRELGLVAALALIAACSKNNTPEGVWKATSVNMGDQVPAELADALLKEAAPVFDLKADKSAKVTAAGMSCDGTWKHENEKVSVDCGGQTMELEFKDGKLKNLPDKAFTFERT